MKTCARCGEAKPLDEFHRRAASKDERQEICKLCKKAHGKARYAGNKDRHRELVTALGKARMDFIRSHKETPCADCGKSYPHYVMDFDHRDPSAKTVNLARMRYATEAKILAEIAKCDLVCANCHRERTWQQRQTT